MKNVYVYEFIEFERKDSLGSTIKVYENFESAVEQMKKDFETYSSNGDDVLYPQYTENSCHGEIYFGDDFYIFDIEKKDII